MSASPVFVLSRSHAHTPRSLHGLHVCNEMRRDASGEQRRCHGVRWYPGCFVCPTAHCTSERTNYRAASRRRWATWQLFSECDARRACVSLGVFSFLARCDSCCRCFPEQHERVAATLLCECTGSVRCCACSEVRCCACSEVDALNYVCKVLCMERRVAVCALRMRHFCFGLGVVASPSTELCLPPCSSYLELPS